MALEHEDLPGVILGSSTSFPITLGGGEQPPALPIGLEGFTPLGYEPHDYAWRVAHEVLPELPENTIGVIDVAQDGINIVAAVERSDAGGTSHSLIRLKPDGTRDESFQLDVPAGGTVTKLHSGSILIGEFPGQPNAASILALQSNGQVAWSFGEPGFEVSSLTEVPGGYVAGGNGIRAFDATGAPLTGYPAITLGPAGSRIHTIYYSPESESLLVGGDFEEINGQPFAYFAEIKDTAVSGGDFRPNGPVRTIKFLQRSTWRAQHLVITGEFTEVNGEPQAYIAGTPYTHVKIGTAPGNYVADVAGEWNDVDQTIQIWSVGRFQEVNGLVRPNLIGTPFWRIVDPISSINRPIDGIESVEISDDQWVKWIWGSFSRINGTSAGPLVQLVRASDIREPGILAGGRFNFTTVGGGAIEVSTDLENWTELEGSSRLFHTAPNLPRQYFRLRKDE